MPALLRIDQAGLPVGTPGVARDDGLATGALVTLTNVGGGSTTKVFLLWVPPEDTTALASLTQTGPNTWTFSPTPGVYGRYRIQLIVDDGLPTRSSTIHTFGIALPLSGLVIPAANELADPSTALQNATDASRLEAAESNAPFSPFVGRQPFGWWKALRDLYAKVESILSGGAPSAFPLHFSGILPGDVVITQGTFSNNIGITQTGALVEGMPIAAVALAFPISIGMHVVKLAINVVQNDLTAKAKITVYKNGVATALTLQVDVGVTGQSNIAGSVAFAPGDTLTIFAETLAAGGAGKTIGTLVSLGCTAP